MPLAAALSAIFSKSSCRWSSVNTIINRVQLESIQRKITKRTEAFDCS